ncbi:unnamed protein product [Owenia fusiformis]|uniref:Uncharacterized protein n=1 Tax=Owenia fusiformis TaxID=6347 RepID=A0A8J1URC0_OWEFU|nr:unnamed protein product [Owenia fusiformis]
MLKKSEPLLSNLHLESLCQLDNLSLYTAALNQSMAVRLSSSGALSYIEQEVDVEEFTCRTQLIPAFPRGSWGLDRIDQRQLPTDGNFTINGTGFGVDVYVLDSGIDTKHSYFGGRAQWGTNTVDDQDVDLTGHGTLVSGVIGSSKYGVAKQARLISVKVIKGSSRGTSTSVVRGLSWIHNNVRKTSRRSVINISLGIPGSNKVLNSMVQHLVRAGIVVVAAAGNSAKDACEFSPGQLKEVITVGASSPEDKMWGPSNYGACVDIYAPGQAITTVWPGNRAALGHGTSIAAPHVTGVVAARMMQEPDSPHLIKQWLLKSSTHDALTFTGKGKYKTPNRLLYAGEGCNE